MASIALIILRSLCSDIDHNNIGSQGMMLLLDKQLPLTWLSVSKYLVNSDKNNITAEGLILMPTSNFAQLNCLVLSNDIFIKVITKLAAVVFNCWQRPICLSKTSSGLVIILVIEVIVKLGTQEWNICSKENGPSYNNYR